MLLSRRAIIRAAMSSVLAAGALAAPFASAGEFPDGKPVHIVVATGPGSGSDLAARQLAAGVSAEWGVPFVV